MTPLYVWLAASVFTVVIWAVRLEAKTLAAARETEALKELLLSKLDELARRLERIERLILNGNEKE